MMASRVIPGSAEEVNGGVNAHRLSLQTGFRLRLQRYNHSIQRDTFLITVAACFATHQQEER